MAENRLAREVATRETEQRSTDWAPSQLLPQPNPRPGWVHRYIRLSMVGQADPTNVSAKFREGWEPVRAEDYPELQFLPDSNSRFKDNVEIGGLLLCKAPQKMVEQRNAYYQKQAEGQMQAVDNNLMRQNDARMPLFNEKRSSTTFGRGTK
jgi:hypothetical protein